MDGTPDVHDPCPYDPLQSLEGPSYAPLATVPGPCGCGGPAKRILKIMPLGDSNTVGVNTYGGYRTKLYDNLVGHQYLIDFVGLEITCGDPSGFCITTRSEMPCSTNAEIPFDRDHEGHSGATTTTIIRGVHPKILPDDWLTDSLPDVILLMIGTNDISLGETAAATANRLSSLISIIRTELPDVHIVLSTIPPRNLDLPGQAAYQAETIAYNALLPDLVDFWNGFGVRVTLVDGFSALTPSSVHFCDALHMNDAGFEALADVWTQAFPVADPEAFCFGDGGDGLGCVECPCDNNAPIGCRTGCTNRVGTNSVLFKLGIPSVSTPGQSPDSLEFGLRGGPPNQLALLTAADNQLPSLPMAPCPQGYGVQSILLDGLRCTGGNILRHGGRMIQPDGSVGIANGWGGPSFPPPTGVVGQYSYTVGQTRHFQVTHRDFAHVPMTMTSCASLLNTSNAISVTMLP